MNTKEVEVESTDFLPETSYVNEINELFSIFSFC